MTELTLVIERHLQKFGALPDLKSNYIFAHVHSNRNKNKSKHEKSSFFARFINVKVCTFRLQTTVHFPKEKWSRSKSKQSFQSENRYTSKSFKQQQKMANFLQIAALCIVHCIECPIRTPESNNVENIPIISK